MPTQRQQYAADLAEAQVIDLYRQATGRPSARWSPSRLTDAIEQAAGACPACGGHHSGRCWEQDA